MAKTARPRRFPQHSARWCHTYFKNIQEHCHQFKNIPGYLNIVFNFKNIPEHLGIRMNQGCNFTVIPTLGLPQRHFSNLSGFAKNVLFGFRRSFFRLFFERTDSSASESTKSSLELSLVRFNSLWLGSLGLEIIIITSWVTQLRTGINCTQIQL